MSVGHQEVGLGDSALGQAGLAHIFGCLLALSWPRKTLPWTIGLSSPPGGLHVLVDKLVTGL